MYPRNVMPMKVLKKLNKNIDFIFCAHTVPITSSAQQFELFKSRTEMVIFIVRILLFRTLCKLQKETRNKWEKSRIVNHAILSYTNWFLCMTKMVVNTT